MSEAELHVLRARLIGGIRNKAARGELRTALPVGLVWGEADGQIRLHPDEAVTGVIAAVFERFAVCGSVRATWLWLREQGLRWPLQTAGYLAGGPTEITWVEPTYHAVHTTLTHPGYAGAYVYGRTRQHRYLGRDGQMRARQRRLPREQWQVLITEHHPRVHRLGHLPGQPGPDRRQHPPAGPRAGHRCRPRGLRAAAGPGHLRELRPQARRVLPGPGQVHPRLLLPGLRPSWSTAAAPDTCTSAARPSTPRSPRRSWPRCSPPRCRPAWPPPTNSKPATTPPWPSTAAQVEQRPLPRRQRRTPLPGRRPGQPAGRPRPTAGGCGCSPARTPPCSPSPRRGR